MKIEKGPKPHAANFVIGTMDAWGLDTDGQPAIVALSDYVRSGRERDTAPRCGPRHSSQSQGFIERANGRTECHVRIVKARIEDKYEATVASAKHPANLRCSYSRTRHRLLLPFIALPSDSLCP